MDINEFVVVHSRIVPKADKADVIVQMENDSPAVIRDMPQNVFDGADPQSLYFLGKSVSSDPAKVGRPVKAASYFVTVQHPLKGDLQYLTGPQLIATRADSFASAKRRLGIKLDMYRQAEERLRNQAEEAKKEEEARQHRLRMEALKEAFLDQYCFLTLLPTGDLAGLTLAAFVTRSARPVSQADLDALCAYFGLKEWEIHHPVPPAYMPEGQDIPEDGLILLDRLPDNWQQMVTPTPQPAAVSAYEEVVSL